MANAPNSQALNLDFMKAILDRRVENDPLQLLPLETASKEDWASMDSFLDMLQDSEKTRKPQLGTASSIDMLSMDSFHLVCKELLDDPPSANATFDCDRNGREHDLKVTDVVRLVGWTDCYMFRPNSRVSGPSFLFHETSFVLLFHRM